MYVDGLENPHKCHKDKRRRDKAAAAREKNNIHDQIRNTPQYITWAIEVYKFFAGVEVVVSSNEVDPQVVNHALKQRLIP